MKERHLTTDVLVIGGGGAALRTAVEAASVKGMKVTVVSKSIMGSGNTRMSTGNFCVALDPGDSTETHFNDTIKGGGYINNQKSARRVVENGPDQLLSLERFGAMFRRKGEYLDHLEGEARGGHSVPRGRGPLGEGLGIIRTLSAEVQRLGIEKFEEAMVTRLLLDKKGAVSGAVAIELGTGTLLVFNAKVVVLAAGGAGQVYSYTTNSNLNTGDGYALAYRAGAELLDMEMVQFIPFCFVYPEAVKGRMIGEGGHYPNCKLLNKLGERFMEKYDPKRLEKSTRDTVSRAIFLEVLAGRGTENNAVWLDNRGAAGLPFFKDRYPIMYKRSKDFYGTREADWLQPFEIMPAVHYFMGGVRMDNYRTRLERLFVVGENAGGVHGGNRLGGNSMLDIMVSGTLGGREAALTANGLGLPEEDADQVKSENERLTQLLEGTAKNEDPFDIIEKVKKTTWDKAGLVRSGKVLQEGLKEIGALRERAANIGLHNHSPIYNLELKAALEAESLLDVAEMIFRSALERTESRCSHYRSDFTERNDAEWLKNVIVFNEHGQMKIRTQDVELTFIRPEEPQKGAK